MPIFLQHKLGCCSGFRVWGGCDGNRTYKADWMDWKSRCGWSLFVAYKALKYIYVMVSLPKDIPFIIFTQNKESHWTKIKVFDFMKIILLLFSYYFHVLLTTTTTTKTKQQMSNNEFFLLQIGKEFSHVLFLYFKNEKYI